MIGGVMGKGRILPMSRNRVIPAAAYLIVAILVAGCMGREAPEPELGPPNPVALPTGQQITPTLPPFASFEPLNPGFEKYRDLAVGGAVTEALSPDGATLAVLTGW